MFKTLVDINKNSIKEDSFLLKYLSNREFPTLDFSCLKNNFKNVGTEGFFDSKETKVANAVKSINENYEAMKPHLKKISDSANATVGIYDRFMQKAEFEIKDKKLNVEKFKSLKSSTKNPLYKTLSDGLSNISAIHEFVNSAFKFSHTKDVLRNMSGEATALISFGNSHNPSKSSTGYVLNGNNGLTTTIKAFGSIPFIWKKYLLDEGSTFASGGYPEDFVTSSISNASSISDSMKNILHLENSLDEFYKFYIGKVQEADMNWIYNGHPVFEWLFFKTENAMFCTTHVYPYIQMHIVENIIKHCYE